MKRVLVLLAVLWVLCAAASATTTLLGTYDVSANGTFFEQSAGDNCSFSNAVAGCQSSFFNPTVIAVTPGEELQLITNGSGSFCYLGIGGLCGGGPLGGVFDSSGTDLLAPSVQNRLPNQVASTLPGIVNSNYNTYYGNMNTTIPDDFYICGLVAMDHCAGTAGTTVVVPTGANFLYLGVLDSFYADNTGNLSVTVNLITSDGPGTGPTGPLAPEPAVYILTLTGLSALAALRLRRA
jgi:hypothetical protein